MDQQLCPDRRRCTAAIASLARILEARDPYTSSHTLRVRDLCVRFGQHLGLDPRNARRLRLAARLHDIGKVALDEAILTKAGPLTRIEQTQAREHPVIGERILQPILRNPHITGAIRSHHERFDGGGYPDGLAGRAIPLLARIISVTDCYDAMTSTRPYSLAMPKAEALAHLAEEAEGHFDPELIRAFVKMMG